MNDMNANTQFWLLGMIPAVAGLLLLVASVNFNIPVLIDPGLITLAMAAVGSGIASCVYRRIVFATHNWFQRKLVVRSGLAAIPFGCMLIIIGLMLFSVASVHMKGMSMLAIRGAVLARPGMLLLPLGLAVFLYGLGFAIGFPQRNTAQLGTVWNILMSIPDRIGALILLVIGSVMLASGSWELAFPVEFDLWITRIAQGDFR